MGAGVERARAATSGRARAGAVGRTGARLLAVAALAVLAALVVGGPSGSAGAADSGEAATPVTVRILPDSLEPAVVQIEPGATVIWVNKAGATRTVLASDASFDSGTLAEGERFQFAFTEPRSVTYAVTQDPGVSGTITVGTPAAPAPTPFAPAATGATGQPSGFAYTGSATAVNAFIGGTILALGAGLLYANRRYGVAQTLVRLAFAPRADDLLPTRRHRRERREQTRRVRRGRL